MFNQIFSSIPVFFSEKAVLENELLKSKQDLIQLQQAEKLLTEQVNIYASKYSEFQGSLKKSHDVFAGYKRDMENMSKKIMKLEKETASWRTKAEKANSIAIDLASEKSVRDEHIAKTHKQLWHLQKLCRTLQAERTVLIAALKENKIEVPPMPEVPSEKEPEIPAVVAPPQGPDRLEIMTKNCAELKKNLAALQGQLSSIENSGDQTTDSSNSTSNNTKKGKQKNKKNKNGKTNDLSKDLPEEKLSEPVVAETIPDPEPDNDNIDTSSPVVVTEGEIEISIKDTTTDTTTLEPVTESSATETQLESPSEVTDEVKDVVEPAQ